ncbi:MULTISPECIES: HWE histidine kinase domain-containing protein [Phyllobacterium]|jgi:PAS domain S-box-containing protein|uniref:HWE histidine kinase domain-containing protein n=1 Tax=Phyllobacterium TaxID=28100 RepID=UPI001CBE3D86|nr:HWE histidine kinase domain-containing protein [Phyllobacterium calauticae]MBZ3695456.1 PAS domain-containing protein [Phyllobacterium calauticae]
MSNIADKSDEQKHAEADVKGFSDDLGPFVVAAETTRMAMVFTDARAPDHPIIFANDSFLELTGYELEEVLGQNFNFLLAHVSDAAALADVRANFAKHADHDSEILYRRKDGSEFWAAIFISPVKDEAGTTVQYFASFVDLTKHRDELAHSKMLIGELNHRVKNTLSTVQSIVWQALRMDADPKTIQQAIESRLQALSRSHDLLTRQNWKDTGLLDVIADALEPFGMTGDRAERIVIKGSNILFSPKIALALGIAFHELATNAIKYGAFSDETGSVTITWDIKDASEGRRLVLRWQEKGGPVVAQPLRRGFGSRMIETGLAQELDGIVRLEYPAEGVLCTMNFPVSEAPPHG